MNPFGQAGREAEDRVGNRRAGPSIQLPGRTQGILDGSRALSFVGRVVRSSGAVHRRVPSAPFRLLPEALTVTPLSVGLGVLCADDVRGTRSNEAATAADPPASAPAPIAGASGDPPAAPVIPGPVVAALQEGKYDVARSSLAALRGETKDRDRSRLLGYLQAITERLAGQKDAARATLGCASAENPAGPGSPRSGSSWRASSWPRATCAAAEELARTEAIRLLADDRKDRLAEVYHAFARRLLEPDDPVIQPDPNGAWELLNQARDLAKGPALRGAAPLRDGPGQPAGGQRPQRPSSTSRPTSRSIPRGPIGSAARFHLGEAQRQAGQLLPARLTWTDLARDIERLQARRSDPRTRRPSGPTRWPRSRRPTASPIRPTTRA